MDDHRHLGGREHRVANLRRLRHPAHALTWPTIPDFGVLKNIRSTAGVGLALAGVAALGALAGEPASAGPTRTTCVLQAKASCAGVRLRERAVHHGDLRRANFRKADLRGADFRGADLRSADFRGANLAGADLRGAQLTAARFQNTPSRRVTRNGVRVLRCYPRCRGANLTGADLSGADLAKADLSFARAADARLVDADLAGATLLLAYLRDADLSGADLSGADLSYASMRGTRRAGITWARATCPDGHVARTRCRGL